MVYPSHKNQSFENRSIEPSFSERRIFERRLEVFDLFLALLVLVLAALLISGCGLQAGQTVVPVQAVPNPPSDQPKPVFIPTEQATSGQRLRITNNRDTTIHNLVVLFPDSRLSYGDIGPNTTSEYLPVPNGVYAYAAYELEIDGKTIMQPVIDWVGESPVAGQDFTFLIDVEPNRGQMNIVKLVQATVDK